jgi:hypothetical protein
MLLFICGLWKQGAEASQGLRHVSAKRAASVLTRFAALCKHGEYARFLALRFSVIAAGGRRTPKH